MNGNIYDLIPKGKCDITHVKELEILSSDEIKPILLPLLEWIQDMNWPVAYYILPILAKHQRSLIPLIINILQPEENDDIWKYWIIFKLLPCFSCDNLKIILPHIQRIVLNPTKGEINEEVNLVARDLIEFVRKGDTSCVLL